MTTKTMLGILMVFAVGFSISSAYALPVEVPFTTDDSETIENIESEIQGLKVRITDAETNHSTLHTQVDNVYLWAVTQFASLQDTIDTEVNWLIHELDRIETMLRNEVGRLNERVDALETFPTYQLAGNHMYLHSGGVDTLNVNCPPSYPYLDGVTKQIYNPQELAITSWIQTVDVRTGVVNAGAGDTIEVEVLDTVGSPQQKYFGIELRCSDQP